MGVNLFPYFALQIVNLQATFARNDSPSFPNQLWLVQKKVEMKERLNLCNTPDLEISTMIHKAISAHLGTQVPIV